jgi:hypothetical protein
MTLPLVPAILRVRAGRHLGAAAALVLVLLIATFPTHAQQAADPYSATVSVDATAADVAKARQLARLDGERRALTQVVQQLSGGAAAPALPKLGDQAISDMVVSYEVANEHMSAVRYLADYTFHFSPAAVQQLMQQAGLHVAPAASQGAPTAPAAAAIVLPVFADGAKPVLWDDPNAWRQAWRQVSSGGGQLLVPLGDARDVATIDGDRAGAGNAQALAAVSQQNGGGDVAVALATAQRQAGSLAGLAVSVKRYRGGSLVGSQNENLTARPGESAADFLERAANATANLIENMPAGAAAAAPSGPEATLSAVVPISGLADWVALQKQLSSLPLIHRIDLLSLTVDEAKVEIRYAGTIDQLKSSLAGAAFALSGGDPEWRLSPAGAAAAR